MPLAMERRGRQMKKKGRFICIEGLDASGKTTQARILVRELQKRGFNAEYTTEPSQGEIGGFIRAYVLQRRKRIPPVVEALLFAVDRLDHVENNIQPALDRGKIIVSDRYVYSSLAYQGAAGLDLNWIEGINRLTVHPDLAIYIDVPPEVVVKRIRRQRSVMETLQTQQKVREVYLALVADRRLVPVNGNRPKKLVSTEILALALDILKS
jgi:dTMP kinase